MYGGENFHDGWENTNNEVAYDEGIVHWCSYRWNGGIG